MAYSAADFGEGRHLEDVQERTFTEQMEEFMFLGLRLTEGVSEQDFQKRFGRRLTDIYGDVLGTMAAEGLMEQDHEKDKHWRLTDQGLDVSNTVLAEFLLDERNRED